jgi:hypothetical protein
MCECDTSLCITDAACRRFVFLRTGLGDDLNKIIWSSMAADPALSPRDITAQYARYFFGAANEALWVEALTGLEVRGWL